MENYKANGNIVLARHGDGWAMLWNGPDEEAMNVARYLNAAYAAGQASSPPSFHIEEHATAMCGDHGGIQGCSCSMCGSPLGPMELTQFCNGCGASVDWPMADGTVVRSKGRANASSAPSLHIGMGSGDCQMIRGYVSNSDLRANFIRNGALTLFEREEHHARHKATLIVANNTHESTPFPPANTRTKSVSIDDLMDRATSAYDQTLDLSQDQLGAFKRILHASLSRLLKLTQQH